VLGAELALRVPLELQTLHFEDKDVLTKEYLSVTIRGTIKWRIVDIRKFYLLVSRELRSTTNKAVSATAGSSGGAPMPVTVVGAPAPADERSSGSLLASAVEWLRVSAKDQTRIIVSHMKSGLLIAERLSTDLPGATAGGLGTSTEATLASGWSGGADTLANAIYDSLAARVSSYGIAIDDVSLQEIELPLEIVKQCIAACKNSYLPLIARQNASERREELRAEADVLGADNVAARELLAAAKGAGLADFVSDFLNQRFARGAAGGDMPGPNRPAAEVSVKMSSRVN
jgi:regulator of protease activity HflC (stomatin/prohibitin superfamily)